MTIQPLSVPVESSGFQIEMAGNSPCPVCAGDGMARVMAQGEWTWDACWLCAEQAEMEYQMEARR